MTVDMISDNEPVLTRYISVPKELSQLNCNAFVAGIVEAVLDGCQFVSALYCLHHASCSFTALLYSLRVSLLTQCLRMDSLSEQQF